MVPGERRAVGEADAPSAERGAAVWRCEATLALVDRVERQPGEPLAVAGSGIDEDAAAGRAAVAGRATVAGRAAVARRATVAAPATDPGAATRAAATAAVTGATIVLGAAARTAQQQANQQRTDPGSHDSPILCHRPILWPHLRASRPLRGRPRSPRRYES